MAAVAEVSRQQQIQWTSGYMTVMTRINRDLGLLKRRRGLVGPGATQSYGGRYCGGRALKYIIISVRKIVINFTID